MASRGGKEGETEITITALQYLQCSKYHISCFISFIHSLFISPKFLLEYLNLHNKN